MEEKDTKKDDCPLCEIPEDVLKILEEKGKEKSKQKEDNNKE